MKRPRSLVHPIPPSSAASHQGIFLLARVSWRVDEWCLGIGHGANMRKEGSNQAWEREPHTALGLALQGFRLKANGLYFEMTASPENSLEWWEFPPHHPFH